MLKPASQWEPGSAMVSALLLSLIIPDQSDFLMIQHHRSSQLLLNVKSKPNENSRQTREDTGGFIYPFFL